MPVEEVLKNNEEVALENNQFISNVSGVKINNKSGKKLAPLGAIGLLLAMIVVIVALFGSGNLIPSAISERLVEETDVQYADAVESKKIVFQQALKSGEIPKDTADILKTNGILVGYIKDGKFIEENKSEYELSLKQGDKIISADDFINEINTNISLYNAFNDATYSRAAYYYDESANKVFQEIGTTRNNYSADSNFDEVMDALVGEGSNININNVSIVESTGVNENGKEYRKVDYINMDSTNSSSSEVGAYIAAVANNNYSNSVNDATLNSADSLKVADTVSKEQRSSMFFLAFMENISKMKAGEGNESKINDAMNYLHKSEETEIVNIKTGEVIKIKGSPLESPSLYAILSGNKVDIEKIKNYSSDRVLNTVENKINESNNSIFTNTVASVDSKNRGSIGRLISGGKEVASNDVLKSVEPTINSSLFNNSYQTIKGVDAGELLVEGAVNVGKKLAKQSGATAGDMSAVIVYQKVNNQVLAMDAKADRLNRSPFDITSKNTFLGSIVRKLATSLSSGSLISNINGFSSVVSSSVISLLPSTYADAIDGYLTNFGECKTIGQIGAVGSGHCSEIATFDMSTLNNPFGDARFVDFINKNTTLNQSGNRTINKDSVLAKFVLYNNERKTPIGVMDGGILNSLSSKSSNIPFISDVSNIIKNLFGSNEEDKKIASGAAFVNTSSNSDWQTYKYAQRYVSLARATEALKQYTSDKTAYNNLLYFEGDENPVTAFLKSFYASNNDLMVPEIFN